MTTNIPASLVSLIDNFSSEDLIDYVRGCVGGSALSPNQEDYSDNIKYPDKFSNLVQVGEIKYANSEKLLLLTCCVAAKLSNRAAKKEQYDLIKDVLKSDFKDGAIFVFYDTCGHFRFSFIRRTYDKQKFTPWRRFTFFVDNTLQTNRTFIGRMTNCDFSSLKSIEEAFKVEPLSDAFFYDYKVQYGKFCGYLTGKYFVKKASAWKEAKYIDHEPGLIQFEERFGNDDKIVRDYVKKLLGRLVFLKFLERKGWLNGNKNFLAELFQGSDKKDNFLDGVLELLFFKILNTKVDERDNAVLDPIFGVGFDIPYLNGGLFENDTSDDKRVVFPALYFEDLFALFNQYNFTIDENDPNDAEVGVDPEMLGRIFENLLEDNKDKGAFYTPKEIVQYMCQESLIQYLKTHLDNNDAIADFVHEGKSNDYVRKYAPKIDELLDRVKICDPAVGSGAFPMGLLQEILKAKLELNLADSHKVTEFKEHIIQNSIFGVDIEQGAVDIARLRFWLSLVVDSEVAKPLPNLDYKIMCGNSLISRNTLDIPIDDVFAEYNKQQKERAEKEKRVWIELTFASYKSKVAAYMNEHDDKRECKNIIEEIKSCFKSILGRGEMYYKPVELKQIAKYEQFLNLDAHNLQLFDTQSEHDLSIEEQTELKNIRKIISDKKKLIEGVQSNKLYEHAFEWRYEFPAVLDDEGKFIGFDIVIANPPYIGEKGHKPIFAPIRKSNLKDWYCKKMDLFYFFYHLSFGIHKNGCGISTFITTNYFPTADGAKVLRRVIKEQMTVLAFVNFNRLRIFDSAGGQHNCIAIFRNGVVPEALCRICYVGNNDDEQSAKLRLQNILNQVDVNTSYYSLLNSKLFEGENNYLRFGENNMYGYEPIFNKMTVGSVLLGSICSVNQGLRTGADKVSKSHIEKLDLPSSFKKGAGIFILTEKEVSDLTLTPIESAKIKALYKNSDIGRWVAARETSYRLIDIFYPNDRDIDMNLYPNLFAHLSKFQQILSNRTENANGIDKAIAKGLYYFASVRRKIDFAEPKIISPQRAKLNVFAYEESEWIASADVYYISQPVNGFELKYILALLNSKLFYFWLKNKCKQKGDVLELYQTPLSEIPIKYSLEQRMLVNLVDEIIAVKRECSNENISIIEAEIDLMVYALYSLTYEEVCIVDPNTTITKESYEKNLICRT